MFTPDPDAMRPDVPDSSSDESKEEEEEPAAMETSACTAGAEAESSGETASSDPADHSSLFACLDNDTDTAELDTANVSFAEVPDDDLIPCSQFEDTIENTIGIGVLNEEPEAEIEMDTVDDLTPIDTTTNPSAMLNRTSSNMEGDQSDMTDQPVVIFTDSTFRRRANQWHSGQYPVKEPAQYPVKEPGHWAGN